MERLSMGEHCEGNLGGTPDSFTGDPEGYVEEGSGNRHLSPEGPHWRTWKGAHLPGILRDG